MPNIPGIHAKYIFTVKTVPDSDVIKTFLKNYPTQQALIIGGGFIGLETAEALIGLGLTVTIVEKASQILPPFNQDMATLVAHHLHEKGVKIIAGDGINGFRQDGDLAKEAALESGKRLPMDLAIFSIGVRPEFKLAREDWLKIWAAGGITVNERQQTSDHDIYAAGDAVETFHLVTGNHARTPLAEPANKQGKVAGANASGVDLQFHGALGTAIVETVGITAAKTGLSEHEAKAHGLNYFVSLTHPLDHAEYYPGAETLHMKLVVEQQTGRLLGAQIVGDQGVDKRIDVLATAMHAKLNVQDLEQLDLAYAPQFNSAKGPVIMAGFVAANTLRGEVNTLTGKELQKKLETNPSLQLLDVGTTDEYQEAHISHARLIPVDELRDHLQQLDPAQETVVYCRVGLRGYLAARILLQHDTNVFNLTGGFLRYFNPDQNR